MSADTLDPIEGAVREGAIRALRKRAAIQAGIAAAGASSPEKHPDIVIRTGEGAIAHRLAISLATIADELAAEGVGR